MSVLTRKDDWLLAAAGMLLCVELAILLSQLKILNFDLPWGGQTETRETIGRVLEKQKTLKDRSLRSLTWYPLAKGDAIHVDDVVMTGPGSSAKIQIEGEGELSLGPDTFVSFGVDRSNPKRALLQLDVDQGTVTVKSEAAPVQMKLKNQNVVLEKGTEVHLSKKMAAKDSRLSVKTGKIAFSSAGTTSEVKAGEVVKIAESETAATPAESISVAAPITKVPTTIDIEVLSPGEGQRLFAKADNSRIEFRWKGPGDRVELSESQDFSNPLKLTASVGSAEARLSSGHYYWRVYDGEAVSRVSQFSLLPSIRYLPLSTVTSLKYGTEIERSWAPIEGAVRYRFELSRDAGFSSKVVEETVNRSEISLGRLEPGTYYWRVQAEHESMGAWPFSPSYTFTIKKPLEAPKPKGIKRFKKEGRFNLFDLLIQNAWAEEGDTESLEVMIEWEATTGAVGYRLEISDKPGFQKPLIQQDVPQISTTAVLPKRDRYYWRVAGRDRDGELGSFSPPQMILYSDLVPAEPQIAIVTPSASPSPSPVPSPQPKKAVTVLKRKDLLRRVKKGPSRTEVTASLGISGTQINQSVESNTVSAEQTGLPLGRMDLNFVAAFDEQAVVVSGWFEPRGFRSKDAIPSDIQAPVLHQKEYGLRALWTWDTTSGIPWTVGVKYNRMTKFVRLGTEEAGIEPLDVVSIVGGAMFRFGDKPYYKFESLLSLSPFSAVGMGADFGLRTGYRRLLFGSLTPEFHLTFHPSYYKLSSSNYRVTTMNLTFGISLGWEFGA